MVNEVDEFWKLTPNEQLKVYCDWIKRGTRSVFDQIDADNRWFVDLVEVFDNENLKKRLEEENEEFLKNIEQHFTIHPDPNGSTEIIKCARTSPRPPGIAKRIRCAIGRSVNTPNVIQGLPSAVTWILLAVPLTIADVARTEYLNNAERKLADRRRTLLKDIISHIESAKQKFIAAYDYVIGLMNTNVSDIPLNEVITGWINEGDEASLTQILQNKYWKNIWYFMTRNEECNETFNFSLWDLENGTDFRMLNTGSYEQDIKYRKNFVCCASKYWFNTTNYNSTKWIELEKNKFYHLENGWVKLLASGTPLEKDLYLLDNKVMFLTEPALQLSSDIPVKEQEMFKSVTSE